MEKIFKSKVLMFRKIFLIVCDVISITLASILALLLRFDLQYSSNVTELLNLILLYLPFNVIITLIIFYIFRLYHSLWTYAGVTEMVNIIISCVLSATVQTIGIMVLNNQKLFVIPRSYYLLYGMCLLLFVVGSRYVYRIIRIILKRRNASAKNKNVMIIGAGDACNTLIKEMKNSHCLQKTVCCVIDDDRTKIGNFIHGIKVVGGREDIIRMAAYYRIDEIIIAMPSSKKKVIKEILNICKETKCELKTLPGIYQLVNGDVNVSALRKVDVLDLLEREPVEVDLESIMRYVANKVVLVTGGGGSIGSELCRQVAGQNPKKLILVDIYENNAYDIQQELSRKYPKLDLVVLIGSVRNTKRMNYIFETYQPNIVYHAAAHKHVPLMEISPNEAIKNNVLGTWKTAQAALKNDVERFVLISTDKAVNPTNIMGASKRMCEMIIQSLDKKGQTKFVAVRFGNVLGSNGSVIPLFRKQIASGGPVTVTHPDIIRYFMTIPEAVSLVLQAGAYAQGGEIFVLDMGEPVKILELAKNLIRLSGYIPGEDIKIEFSGLRPGEKLYEELLMKEEGMQSTENQLIFIGKPIEFDKKKFFKQLEQLKEMTEKEEQDIKKEVQKIVPTYVIEENE
ncbi:polysaccharide biosynthesis protein [Anaerosacchariphilus polymeriproducens]|uniref:Polysaccharide biosynthesis protein n=1 Tax=Anaerosacchariphilus polymeriproducens TaxID=1812858 RepID=A0A371AQX8_9FIRM|nr:nucleoside-diphosphate sugar epimerase/dehydratase [Anaerosacchariphilus polymeriproducens]RDU21991.1 polysaccharide biosynthesis protein [Anaerosacchariphilus polymeriproducens]